MVIYVNLLRTFIFARCFVVYFKEIDETKELECLPSGPSCQTLPAGITPQTHQGERNAESLGFSCNLGQGVGLKSFHSNNSFRVKW